MTFDIKNNWFITLSAFAIALGITLGTGSFYRFVYSYNLIMTATLFIMTVVVVYQYFIPIITDNLTDTTATNQAISIAGIILVSFMLFLPLFSAILNNIFSHEIVFFYMAILLLSFLLEREFRKKVLNAYLIIIVTLSVLSILMVFLAVFTDYLTLFPSIRITSPFLTDFYFISSVNPYSIFARNQSIFWEPSAFGFHLIIATLLAYKSNNKLFIMILILACITTFSTTVFIFLVLLGIYHISLGQSRLKMLIIIFSISALFYIILIVIMDNLLFWQLIVKALIEKFSPTSASYNSFTARTLYTFEALKMFLDNIFFGAGHYATHTKLEVVVTGETVNTSGLAGLLAELGLFGVFCVFLYTRYFWRFSIIAIPITLIWLNGVFLQYSPLALFILADAAEEFAQELFPLKRKSRIK